MEIEVHQRLTGREMRTAILEKYGSREALEKAAQASGGMEAWGDLVMLKTFDEKPSRLDLEHEASNLVIPTAEELQRLTPKRLELLQRIYALERPMNVRQLAKLIGRDKKNVSQDLRVLADFELIDMIRGGREARPVPKATEIRIILRRSEKEIGPAPPKGSAPPRRRTKFRPSDAGKPHSRKAAGRRTQPSR